MGLRPLIATESLSPLSTRPALPLPVMAIRLSTSRHGTPSHIPHPTLKVVAMAGGHLKWPLSRT